MDKWKFGHVPLDVNFWHYVLITFLSKGRDHLYGDMSFISYGAKEIKQCQYNQKRSSLGSKRKS